MPQAEWDVCEDFSSTTMSSRRPPAFAVRSAWCAALMPAASPPITTTRSTAAMAEHWHAAGPWASPRSLLPQIRVGADPRVHGDRGGSTGVQGAGRTELGDREDDVAAGERLAGQARALLAEQQDAPPRHRVRLQRHGARSVVDAQHRQPLLDGPAPQPVG